MSKKERESDRGACVRGREQEGESESKRKGERA